MPGETVYWGPPHLRKAEEVARCADCHRRVVVRRGKLVLHGTARYNPERRAPSCPGSMTVVDLEERKL